MLLFTRGARGFADGVVSVLLASYLGRLGFTPVQIGAIVTATLLGSAALTLGIDAAQAERAGFLLYSALGLIAALAYARLSPAVEHDTSAPARPLARSRGIVLQLSALFSLDSFGGGFVVQSLLVLWLFRRFALPVHVAGAIFFAAGLLAAFSQFVAARLAARIGHVRTMVFTHLPADIFLLLAAIVPTAPLSVPFFLRRDLAPPTAAT